MTTAINGRVKAISLLIIASRARTIEAAPHSQAPRPVRTMRARRYASRDAR